MTRPVPPRSRALAGWLGVLSIMLILTLSGCGGGGGGASTGSANDGSLTGMVSGQAANGATGAGLQDVKVVVADSSPRGTVASGTSGSYQVGNLSPGAYVLTVTRDGFNPVVADVSVSGGKTTTKDLKMTVATGETGMYGVLSDASGNPLAGATVSTKARAAIRSRADDSLTTTTTSDGFYTFANLSTGVYVVTITHPSAQTRVFSVNLQSGVMLGRNVNVAPATVDPNTVGIIQGFVQDDRGTAVAQANISLNYQIQGTPAPYLGQSDENGFYAIVDVVASTYSARAEHPNFLPKVAENIAVSAGQATSQDIILEFKLVYTGNTEAQVTIWGNAANNVFSAGALGTMRHFDGATWAVVTTPTSDALESLWGTQDGSLILGCGATTAFVRSTDGGRTWSMAPFAAGRRPVCVWGTADGSLIIAVARPEGAGSLEYGIYRSTDRGTTWTPIQSALGVVDSTVGVGGASDGSRIFVICEGSRILRSKDRGTTWERLETSATAPLTKVWSSASGRAVCAGTAASSNAMDVVTSSDGGDTWTRVRFSDPRLNSFRSLGGLADGSALYIAGTTDCYRSTDAGLTWSSVMRASTDALNSCAAVGGTTEVIVFGDRGRVYRSSDGGTSWRSEVTGTTCRVGGVVATSAHQAAVVGVGTDTTLACGLLFDGSTWKSAFSSTYSEFMWLWGSNPDRLYAVDYYNGVYRSTDRGASYNPWKFQDNADIRLGAIWNSPDEQTMIVGGWMAATEAGLLLTSHDRGETWRSCVVPEKNPFYGVWGSDDGQILQACGKYGALYRSADGGTTWTRTGNTSDHSSLSQIWGPSDSPELYAVGVHVALISRDGGNLWNPVDFGTSPYEAGLRTVWGSSSKDVYFVGKQIHHFDGVSWKRMTALTPAGSGTNFDCYGLSGTPDGQTVYAVGEGGRVYVHGKLP